MSDSVQNQETGGGEGVAAPAPQSAPAEITPEVPKPAEPAAPEPEIKTEAAKEAPKVEEKPAEEAKETPKVEEKPAEEAKETPKVEEKLAEEAKETPKVEQKPAEEVKQEPVAASSAEATSVPEQTTDAQTNGADSWQEREKQLLKKIEELEKVKNERTEDGLKLELKIREEEIDLLKARVKNLETELQAAMSKPSGKNQEMIDNIKQQHEELLSKARGMIFDKTKMVKNQELQIEALTTQVQSLKDINQITKDLLEIRNGEIKAMEDRLQVMEARFKAEKNRYDLVLQRAQTSTNINDDLRKEYETQLAIFKELREKYELRVQALVAENNKLKETAKGGTSS